MSKIVLYPANGYDFDAADVAAYLAGLTSGVFSGDEDFPVTAARRAEGHRGGGTWLGAPQPIHRLLPPQAGRPTP